MIKLTKRLLLVFLFIPLLFLGTTSTITNNGITKSEIAGVQTQEIDVINNVDSYELSNTFLTETKASRIIDLQDWQTGFSISSENLNDITDVGFKFIYADDTFSDLFAINENTDEQCEDKDITKKIFASELYTSSKSVKKVEFYYEKNQNFIVSTYPNTPPTKITTLSVEDANRVAYKKEFMSKLGLNIITRNEWGAPVSMPETFITTAVDRIVIHHTATSVDLSNPKNTVKAIFDYHNCSKEDYLAGKCASNICCDIGYNYLIDPYGNLYEGRYGFVRLRGAHAVPNGGSIGISLLGNFQNETPTPAALQTLTKLVAGLSQVYNIDLTLSQNFTTGDMKGLMGHKDVISCPNGICSTTATSCPGTNLYSLLNTIRESSNQLKQENTAAKQAYDKATKLTSRNNIIVKDGYAQYILQKEGLDPIFNFLNYTTDQNNSYGIIIIQDNPTYVVIGIHEPQHKQYLSEILLINPESKIQPDYQYEISALGTNDTYGSYLWALENTGQNINGITGTDNADIKAPEAWGVTEGNTDNVIVAIIDTGVAYNNPDLIDNMWDGSSCVNENNTPVIGGCLHGYDYLNNDNNPLPGPTDPLSYRYHGTVIAGIIGARKNNNIGVVGIAPKVKLMAVKSAFNTSSILEEVNFAKNNGAKIINASWGTDGGTTCMDAYDETLYNALANFPGLIFVAAGNSNREHNLTTYFNAPADYGHTTECWTGLDNIISVGATDQNNNRASFSDYGYAIDIAAPGDNIFSTTDNTIYEGYGFMSGTSMATPYVSGLAAYIWSSDLSKTNSQVKNQILNGGDTLTSLCYKFGTQKRINAFYSISAITTLNSVCENDSVAPIVNAGNDIHSYMNIDRNLSGTASDALAGVSSTVWTVESGPGTVSIYDDYNLNTTIHAHSTGTYVIRLTSKDHVLNSSYDDLNLIIHKTADYNNDDQVDELDFAYLAIYWDGSNLMADFNGDGYIDEIDFALLAINWSGS